jgi:drug/metabolite transporter (DMT)-like permease
MGSIIAEGAIVLAAAHYAVSFIYLKRFLIPTGASSLTIAAGQITASALMLLALDPTGPGVVLHGGARVDLSVLTLGIIQTGFAALLSTRLVRQVSATVSSAVTYLIAVVSVAEGFFFQHQKLELVFFAGALVVMVGLFITSSGDSMSFFESRAKGLKPSS